MSKMMTLASVQPKLLETVDAMLPGEELHLTAADETVAVLTRVPQPSWPCQPGIAAGQGFWMADDFDAPLDDFDGDKE